MNTSVLVCDLDKHRFRSGVFVIGHLCYTMQVHPAVVGIYLVSSSIAVYSSTSFERLCAWTKAESRICCLATNINFAARP